MLNETQIVAEPGGRDVVLTRRFAAPRSKVFDAWTHPEQVAVWWDPTGTPLAACEIDLRPDGAFRFVTRGPGGEEHPFAGAYREIVPGERIVLQTPLAVGTLLFRDWESGTELTLTLECETPAARDEMLRIGIADGTAQTLANLAAFLVTVRR